MLAGRERYILQIHRLKYHQYFEMRFCVVAQSLDSYLRRRTTQRQQH
jgi:hypothetical protein